METKRIFKQNKVKKTFSLRFRFLSTVIVSIIAITIFIGGLSIYEVDNYIMEQSENFVQVTCENECANINDSFADMEKSVKIMESYLMGFFESAADVEDRALQEEVIKSADEMFSDITKHTSTKGAISYYFRFDPEISTGTSGLFYSKLNGSNEFTSLEPTDLLLYEKHDTEHVGWFWVAYDAGEPVWLSPYHNQNTGVLMISYVIPMYIGDKFIGIIGMDFDYMALTEQVHKIEIYENGFAHLEIDGTVICVDQIAFVTDNYSEKYLRKSKEMVNGMTLVISASYDDIRQIRHEITFKILFAVLILSLLFMVIAVFAVRKIVEPLKKLTDASVKLSNGDYDVEISCSDTREIQLLSSAFEKMATNLREREELLRLSANRDSLTGLRNTTSYTSWVSKFEKEISDKNAEFGVVVLDLNDLKEMNDKYGHEAGNLLIVTAANVISSVFRKSPVFRIGGDEFLIVLQGNDLENGDGLFFEFESKCSSTFIEKENVKIPIRIASGFARFEPDLDSHFSDVFKRADAAMYENKRKMKMALE